MLISTIIVSHHAAVVYAIKAVTVVILMILRGASGEWVNCDSWVNSTTVNVTVETGDVAVLSGCVAEGVNVTLQCAPGSSVVLSGWVAPAVGSVTLTGVPQASGAWVLEDVDVFVVDSVVVAVSGPAIGIAVDGGDASVLITNVSLRVVNSTLMQQSRGPETTAVVVAGVAISGVMNVTVEDVVLSATNSTLMGDGGGQSDAVAVLGVVVHAETGAGGALGSATVSNLLLSACTTVLLARDAVYGSSAAGIVAVGGGWASLTLRGVVVCLAESNVSAIAGAAAVVGGIAVTGDTASANDPQLQVRVSDVSWVMDRVDALIIAAEAATAAGVAVGVAADMLLGGGAIWIVASSVNCSSDSTLSSGTAYSAAAIAGVSGAFITETQLQNNVTVWIAYSVMTCSSSANGVADGDNFDSLSASAIGGVAAGAFGVSQAQEAVTVWIGYSNVSSSSSAMSSETNSYTSSVVAGVVAVFSTGNTQQSQRNVTVWIGYSTVSSYAFSTYRNVVAISAVAGVASAPADYYYYVSAPDQVVQDTVTVWIGYSTVSSSGLAISTSSSLQYCVFQSVSAVSGVASDTSDIAQNNLTAWIGFSTVTSSGTGSGLAPGCGELTYGGTTTSTVAGASASLSGSSATTTNSWLWTACSSISSTSSQTPSSSASATVAQGCPPNLSNNSDCCGNNTALLPSALPAVFEPPVCGAPPGASSQWCPPGYGLQDGACLANPGTPCAASENCRSGNCQGGHCCNNTVSSECISCSASGGACINCTGGYTLQNGTCLANPGTPCAASESCTSGNCQGGHCCSGTVGAECDNCTSSNGTCDGTPDSNAPINQPFFDTPAQLDAVGVFLVITVVYPNSFSSSAASGWAAVGAVNGTLLSQTPSNASTTMSGTAVSLYFTSSIVRNTTWRNVTQTILRNGTAVLSGTAVSAVEVGLWCTDGSGSTQQTLVRGRVSYAVPEYVVRGALDGQQYSVRLTIMLAPNSSGPVDGLRLLAYGAPGVEDIVYPVMSDTVGCAYDGQNMSVACAAPNRLDTASATWVVDLYAEPPSYYGGVVVASVYVTAAQAPPVQFTVSLTEDGALPLLVPLGSVPE